MQQQYAVVVKNGYKSYGKKQILINFNMTVERGIIYGLLGPSGCGKTTLLNCIVGRKIIDQGEMWVLGGTPGTPESGIPGPKVGYMPQDIALIGEMSVKSCIYYFGRILNMSEDKIGARYYALKNLLDLPPDHRLLRECSGGQQRRVSFAAAMIHDPELLILDEPTVGLDPILRESIWDYLVELTKKQNIAVIITTHYIEEARQANKIGLMREGKLLAERSPDELLARYRKDTLEDVFLLLSEKQEENNLPNYVVEYNIRENNNVAELIHEDSIINSIMANRTKRNLNKKSAFGTPIKSTLKVDAIKRSYNPNRIKALLIKNWTQYSRNLMGVCWSLAFPVIQILAFFTSIGTDIKDVNLAIVNHENINNLCGSYNIHKTAIIPFNDSDCIFSAMSCRFLDEVADPMLELETYQDISLARNAVEQGKAVGILYMAENFTEALESRMNNGKDVTIQDIEFGEIKVWLDMSNRQVGSIIKMKLYEKYFDFIKGVMSDCKYPDKLSNLPIRFEDPVYGNFNAEYTVFMISGVIMSFIFYMGTTMTSTIIISDRMEGVWDRSIVCGVTSLEILLTHLITQFVLIVMQVIEIFILIFAIYGVDYYGSLPLLIFITILQGLCGMCYGFFISVISGNHNMANIAATGSFFPMICICGIIWPLESQPFILQWISKLLPITIPAICFRNVMTKGWSISNFDVYIGVLVEIGWILLLSLVNLLLMIKDR